MVNYLVNLRLFFLVILAIVNLLTITGCNFKPSTVETTGKVMLDSKPVSNAEVFFESLEKNGHSAIGMTNANGVFNMNLVDGSLGVVPGKYHVSISTFKRGDPKEGIPDTPELIPVEYNERSSMEVTVTADKHQFDFNIEEQKSKKQPKWRK